MTSRSRVGPVFSEGVSLVRLSGDRLPTALSEMRKAPTWIRLWGRLPPGPYVSIVGTRIPSSHGRRAAFRFAAALASRGVTILSGGAIGIDTAAHSGALSVGGRTVVVGPTRFEEAYPKENRALFSDILESGGGYLSLAESGQIPFNSAFFLRNEALVALSHAVVLGECPLQSGAKNAMLHARRLNRARLVLPFPFAEERARGSFEEVTKMGARLIFGVECLWPLLEQAGTFENPKWWEFLRERANSERTREAERASRKTKRRRASVTDQERRASGHGQTERRIEPPSVNDVEKLVGAAVRAGGTTVDLICRASGLSASEVQHQVLLLTLRGRVAEDESGLLRYTASETDE